MSIGRKETTCKECGMKKSRFKEFNNWESFMAKRLSKIIGKNSTNTQQK